MNDLEKMLREKVHELTGNCIHLYGETHADQMEEAIMQLFATHYKAREAEIREDELIRLDYAIENRPNLSTSPNGGDVQRYADARRRMLKGEQEYDPRMHLGYPAVKLSKDSKS